MIDLDVLQLGPWFGLRWITLIAFVALSWVVTIVRWMREWL